VKSLGSRRSVSLRELKRELRRERSLSPELARWEDERPTTRGACRDGPRPCPWIACRYHLFLEVSSRTGSLRLNVPGREVWELEETCALDVAERGPATLEQIGQLLDLTRERVRQLERLSLIRLRHALFG